MYYISTHVHMYMSVKHDYYRTDARSNIINITPVNRIIYENMSSPLDYALAGTRRDHEPTRQTLRTNSGATRVVVGGHFCM